MHRTLSLFAAALIVSGAAFWTAFGRSAIDPSGCKLRHAVKTIDTLASLPSLIQDDLRTRMAPPLYLQMPLMSDRGGAFNATDVIIDPATPLRRFLHAGQADDLWFIWYEHGGRGYHAHIVVYKPPAVLVQHLTVFPENLCTATDAALEGRTPPDARPAEEEW